MRVCDQSGVHGRLLRSPGAGAQPDCGPGCRRWSQNHRTMWSRGMDGTSLEQGGSDHTRDSPGQSGGRCLLHSLRVTRDFLESATQDIWGL